MHCSVWRFTGDPEALERGYRELMAQIPASNHLLHAAARTPDGLLIFDTCPSEQAYHAFFGYRPRARPLRGARSPGRRRGGLPARGGLRATQRGHGRDVGSASGARLKPCP